MKEMYCIVCGKHIKFENPKISYIFEKTLVLSITCINCGSKDEKIFKKEEWIKILKILALISSIIEQYQKNITEKILVNDYEKKDKAW